MQRLWIAIRVFFIVLFNAKIARQVDDLLAHRNEPEKATIRETPPKAKEAPVKPAAKAPVRSEAITLLAALHAKPALSISSKSRSPVIATPKWERRLEMYIAIAGRSWNGCLPFRPHLLRRKARSWKLRPVSIRASIT